jgi:hypothetical protein
MGWYDYVLLYTDVAQFLQVGGPTLQERMSRPKFRVHPRQHLSVLFIHQWM